MDISEESVTSSAEDAYDVFNIKNIPSLLSSYDESINEASQGLTMTSLGAFVFLSQNESKVSFGFEPTEPEPEEEVERLSLAYERLHCMPKVLLYDLAPKIKILDISHNEFENLEFLKNFKQLTNLICDRNYINSSTRLPYMPKLELLWLNHCKIYELYPWIKCLQESCPNLKYLSLMGNRGVPSVLHKNNFCEYLQYRLYVISLFPNLIHLDDQAVTAEQHLEAAKLNKKTILERLCANNKIPAYLRTMTELFSSSGSSSTSPPPMGSFPNQKPKNAVI